MCQALVPDLTEIIRSRSWSEGMADKTFPINIFPFRCDLGEGCPKLFKPEYEKRSYCIFMDDHKINIGARNEGCCVCSLIVQANLVRRKSEDDY
jgi:hypothetical protein